MQNTLFILTKQSMPSLAAEAKAIVLINEAVYLLLQKLPDALKNTKIYALAVDIEARGLKDISVNNFELIDYAKFVGLSEQYNNIITW